MQTLHCKQINKLSTFAFFNSKKIRDVFVDAAAVSAEYLEHVKNEVDAEQDDYEDVMSIMSSMRTQDVSILVRLFRDIATQLPLLYYHPRQIKIVCDVDDTLIAPTTGDLIPGLIPLIRTLSANGLTTVTFVSARPRITQILSIRQVKRVLRKSGLYDFSFKASGKLWVSAKMLVGKNKDDTRQQMANGKTDKMEELRVVYPSATFIFFGDDTQGDFLCAYDLVARDPTALAYIRKTGCVNPVIPISPQSPRIIYHASYYEAIAHTPMNIIPNFLNSVLSLIVCESAATSVARSDEDRKWISFLLD